MRLKITHTTFILFIMAGWGGFSPSAADAQFADPGTLYLTLDEAIQIAVDRNYRLQEARLDVGDAETQVREAWGQVMPQVNASGSYQRNLKTANPFAGSDAGGFFQSFGYLDWLAYNEGARTDGDPGTSPISLDEFQRRRQQGYEDAGIHFSSSANPFAVDNQFTSGISITQSLYNRSAFSAIRGAERLREIYDVSVHRQAQLVRKDVTAAFYAALLAQEQADVVANSVSRIQRTVQETEKQLAQGVTSRYQYLSAEVEHANLETQFISALNSAELAVNNFKMQLGLPIDQAVELRGSLSTGDELRFTTISIEDAVELALQHRPDLRQAQIAIELYEIQEDITRAARFPTLSAFADLNYLGNVPDNRLAVIADPNDPFSFQRDRRGFFSTGYWNPNVAVGVRLNWNIFNGFQTSARVQREQIAVQRARLQHQELQQLVRLEIEQAMRNLLTAERRIESQKQNVGRAELNYEFAVTRLREGVSSQLEERQASDLLDQSRLNYAQAVHDYLVARSAFEAAIGRELSRADLIRLTSR